VRNVLGYVGVTVTRLIRVSFGPFQLGELAEGAVEEVPTRTLREQLGAQVVALSGADFSAPLAQPSHPANAPAGGDTEATRPAAWDERPQRPGRRPANAVRPAREDRADKTGKPRGGRRDAAPQAHAWRRPEDGRPGKKLQRKFRGTRRDDGEERQRASGKPRAGMLTDRKGRAVAVERFGEPPREPAAPERKARQPRRRRSPDRSSGPRPRTPKGR
jgi:23S rRNA pseudouridine2605 synthase